MGILCIQVPFFIAHSLIHINIKNIPIVCQCCYSVIPRINIIIIKNSVRTAFLPGDPHHCLHENLCIRLQLPEFIHYLRISLHIVFRSPPAQLIDANHQINLSIILIF